MFLGSKVRLTTLPPSMSRLSRQCGILNISQPYRLPRSVTGIALLSTVAKCLRRYATSRKVVGARPDEVKF
jgi:hypothetical protein